MSEQEALFLFLMALGAFFMPFLSKRLMLPAAVGEIIYGIIIASLIPYGESQLVMVEYFSSLGFLILMYLAGLEIDFERFKALPKNELWLYVLTFIPVALVAWYLSYKLELAWAFAIIFFTSGIGLLFPVLKDTGLLKTDFGQKLLIITMIGEILTLAGLTVLTIISKYGITIDSARQILYIAVLIFAPFIFVTLHTLKKWFKQSNLDNSFYLMMSVLFLLIGYLAGHAIKNVMLAPLYSILYSLVYNKIRE